MRSEGAVWQHSAWLICRWAAAVGAWGACPAGSPDLLIQIYLLSVILFTSVRLRVWTHAKFVCMSPQQLLPEAHISCMHCLQLRVQDMISTSMMGKCWIPASELLLWAAAASRMLMASVWLELYRLLAARLLSDFLPAHTALMVPPLPASGRGGLPFATCPCRAQTLLRRLLKTEDDAVCSPVVSYGDQSWLKMEQFCQLSLSSKEGFVPSVQGEVHTSSPAASTLTLRGSAGMKCIRPKL